MILHGDCLEKLKEINSVSLDAVITDPPYGISFMGKKWDYDVPSIEVWRECLRVLKPGGHALIACGTRTQHRMAVNIEEAGFEIRDVVTWLYGSGFPKSHNIKDGDFKGWGTALKPACEFWTLARKPLVGTVAQNLKEYGAGALNIDGCRVGSVRPATINDPEKFRKFKEQDGVARSSSCKPDLNTNQGRWPANLILDQEAAALLDEHSGVLKSGALNRANIIAPNKTYGAAPKELTGEYAADSGGASRFFYVAKASKSERNQGLEKFSETATSVGDSRPSGSMNERLHGRENRSEVIGKNHHPTVKPIKLMRYLCRLITPPGGTVLDPFMGSGSTGVGAIQEGFEFIGIEREAEYVEIAKARMLNATNSL
jgi:site-specific DNA-methyltransferase (adenine-specific)